MSPDLHSSIYEPHRLFNPWEKLTHRDEKEHVADKEAQFRLGRLSLQPPASSPTSLPQTPVTKTSAEIIELFLRHGSFRLDDAVPRQQQLVKDFLQAALLTASSSSRITNTFIDDVKLAVGDMALLDDRNNHEGCVRKFGKACSDCYALSKKMTIPDLCTHLEAEVSRANKFAKRLMRLTCICDCSA